MAGLVEKAKLIKESSGQEDPKVNQQPENRSTPEQTQEPELQIVIEPEAPKEVEPELQIVIQPEEQMSKL